MAGSSDRHRAGYHAEREQEDKKIRKAAKVVQWDVAAEDEAREVREQWRYDLRQFCLDIFPDTFYNGFGKYHDAMLAKMQATILNGGQIADAMPRGSGKTTCAQIAIIWAVLYGHRKFGVLVCAEGGAATELMDDIKTYLWQSEGIKKHWPKLSEYLNRGDGQSQKYRHLLNSDQTPPMISWGKERIRLPTTPTKEADDWSGAIIHSCGITGRIRGMKKTLTTGEVLRPDFVLVDDPQSRESAKSITQINDRESTINADIMGLAGPNRKIACFMAMTVIYPNDLACHYLDKQKYPDWNASRVPMLISWPKAKETLWEEYNMIRTRLLHEEKPLDEANQFYIKNREAMDEGAEVYWEDRKFDTDISPVQHAMNLWFKNPTSFLSEYQNEPIEFTGGAPYVLEPMDVMTATNGRRRLEVPPDAPIIVGFTDINYSGLNTVVVAATNDAVRYVIDYQTYPGNGVPLYDPKDTFKKKENDQIAIARALDAHLPQIGSARYIRNGRAVRPDLILLDAGNWMDLVFRWCAANRHRVGNLYPSRGRAYNKYRPSQLVGKPGDNFHVADWEKRGKVLVHNADEWRMRTQKAFLLPAGVKGSLSLFGESPVAHKRFADEVCAEVLAEYIEATEGGNQFFKWGHKVGIANDLLDALVGAVAGTAYMGASETGLGAVPGRRVKPKARRPVRLKL